MTTSQSPTNHRAARERSYLPDFETPGDGLCGTVRKASSAVSRSTSARNFECRASSVLRFLRASVVSRLRFRSISTNSRSRSMCSFMSATCAFASSSFCFKVAWSKAIRRSRFAILESQQRRPVRCAFNAGRGCRSALRLENADRPAQRSASCGGSHLGVARVSCSGCTGLDPRRQLIDRGRHASVAGSGRLAACGLGALG